MKKVIIEMEQKLEKKVKHLQLVTGKALHESDEDKKKELLADVIRTSEDIGMIKITLSVLETSTD